MVCYGRWMLRWGLEDWIYFYFYCTRFLRLGFDLVTAILLESLFS